MTSFSDYVAYFEGLAKLFLGHAENEKHFFRKGLEEFLNGLQTSVNYPAMLLENYDYRYIDNGGDNVMQTSTAAFLIIDHASDTENYERIDEIKDTTKLIVDKIYNQIRRDIAPETEHEFLRYARLNVAQVTPVENYADGNYGFFVTIEILTHHNTLI